ncbi:lysis system i-spanin subunit Rz [Burkholderia oklahomensis]|uniref:lysis system i-spanin subunit Rz n=1 Tax=Burkholderia oklahomensis TaxID=342113 RepID=UPI0005721E4C|nr:lysis system i-spanin subunit Rz [Burkholderia oklahomensis]AOI42560.1 lysozyme [Burkholderia oklahomensis EO147]KUY60097.1 lysozyme [Burkholderia oklahomensis EO147]QPS37293.1 lysis protein [Burkholderia oklahomensis]
MPKAAISYLLVVVLGAAAGAVVDHLIGARQLSDERAARAVDAKRHTENLNALSRAALDAERRAIAAHDAAASAVTAVDAKLTKERNVHEAESRNYRAALASGTDRLRVEVRNCTAADRDGVSNAASTAGVGDGAAAYADLDRAVAERIFAVAGDDQREIDKLTALQGYVCAVRPQTPECQN